MFRFLFQKNIGVKYLIYEVIITNNMKSFYYTHTKIENKIYLLLTLTKYLQLLSKKISNLYI